MRRQAPEDIAKPEVTRSDPHALQLARLEWELAKRRELGEEAERREGERDGLELGIRQREERLRELQPQLQAVLAASLPVQEYLALPLDHRREQAQLARLLPAPLYICYSQVAAYSEAGDPLVEAAVRGDAEEARKWMDDQKAEQAEDEADEEVREQDSQDDDDENKKKRGKSSAKADVKKEAVLAFHPLWVALEVKAKEVTESSLLVTLHFLPALGIVTVQSSLGGEAKLSGEVRPLPPSTARLSTRPPSSPTCSPVTAAWRRPAPPPSTACGRRACRPTPWRSSCRRTGPSPGRRCRLPPSHRPPAAEAVRPRLPGGGAACRPGGLDLQVSGRPWGGQCSLECGQSRRRLAGPVQPRQTAH
jgi:hypothetical protein